MDEVTCPLDWLEHLPLGAYVCVFDDPQKSRANTRFVSELGELAGEPPATAPFANVHDDDVAAMREARAELAGRGKAVYELRLAASSGSLWRRCRIYECAVDTSGRPGILGLVAFTDTTAPVTGLGELPSLRELFRRLDRKRQLIAYNIHDGLLQEIISVQIAFEGIAQQAQDVVDHATLDLVRQQLSKAIDEGRRLINGLRPPALDEMGVVEAIEHMVEEERAKGRQEIRFRAATRTERLPAELEANLFWIAHESLYNATRHSEAGRIDVRIRMTAHQIRLEVVDDGVGFDPDTPGPRQDHFGLTGIRERARLFGGQAAIESQPGSGTHVVVELPLQ